MKCAKGIAAGKEEIALLFGLKGVGMNYIHQIWGRVGFTSRYLLSQGGNQSNFKCLKKQENISSTGKREKYGTYTIQDYL